MSFPLRGILPTIGLVVAAILTVWIGNIRMGVDPGTLSVYTLFATWFAFVLSTGAGWPIEKVGQPSRGIIFIVVCLIYGIFHMWAQPVIFGISSDFFWPAIANLFLAIGITIALDNKLVEGLKQPAALFFNILFWYLFAYGIMYIVPVFNGMVPAIWFGWFVFYFFWLERYPIVEMPQPYKAVLSFAFMAGAGLLLNYIFKWFFNTSFFLPEGGLWFACWVFWLVITSWIFDTWPFQQIKQPLKGLVGLVVTAILGSITYAILVFGVKLNVGDAGGYVWVFICWAYIWPICLGKWPATLPEESLPEEALPEEA